MADACREVIHSRALSPISYSLAARATRLNYKIAQATLSTLPWQPQEREVDVRGLLPCHCSCRGRRGAGKERAGALRRSCGMAGWSQGPGPLHPWGVRMPRAQPCWLVLSRQEQHSSQVSLSAGLRGVGEEDGKRRAMLQVVCVFTGSLSLCSLSSLTPNFACMLKIGTGSSQLPHPSASVILVLYLPPC